MDTQILLVNLSYIAAAILFVFGIKMLGHADTARKGNRISSIGMALAIIVTLLSQGLDYKLVLGGIAVGSVIGFIAAKRVQMTGMPELVALFNGFGGLASLLVGWAEYQRASHTKLAGIDIAQVEAFTAGVIVLAILIGGITFTGSLYAWGKLSGKLSGRALTFGGQKAFNALLALGIIAAGAIFTLAPTAELAYPTLDPSSSCSRCYSASSPSCQSAAATCPSSFHYSTPAPASPPARRAS